METRQQKSLESLCKLNYEVPPSTQVHLDRIQVRGSTQKDGLDLFGAHHIWKAVGLVYFLMNA